MSDYPNYPVPPETPDSLLERTFSLYLSRVWHGQVTCPICNSPDWDIKAALDIVLRYRENFVLTTIPVQCSYCHYLLLFNGHAAGLFRADGMPEEYSDYKNYLDLAYPED